MRITTNYSKQDWKYFIPSLLITLSPSIVFIFGTIYYGLPHIEKWGIWLDFLTDKEIITAFADYIQTTQLIPFNDLLSFFMIMWFGASIFPIILFHFFTKWCFPTEWIIKKLNIEPRMKLVVFINGKPITWGKKK